MISFKAIGVKDKSLATTLWSRDHRKTINAGKYPDEHGFVIGTPDKLRPSEAHHYDMGKDEEVIVQIMEWGRLSLLPFHNRANNQPGIELLAL